MFCALSGESPEDPVVSKVSGSVFEKRLILKYITDNGRDPVNGEDLSVDDLLPLKLTNKFIKPRPPAASSIPNLLISLQNEWDSVMLETYQLKQQYHTARQELSNALYENDAAKRVIARLMLERDEARAALASVQATYTAPAPSGTGVSKGDDQMDVDQERPAPVSEELARAHEKMQATSAALSKIRRKRKPAATCATADQVRAYSQLLDIPGNKTSSISSLDIVQQTFAGEKRDWIITGSAKGKITILDRDDGGKAVASVAAHKTPVRDVLWKGTEAGSLSFLTASTDKTIKMYDVEHSEDADFRISKVKHTWKSHTAAVASLSMHPTGDYFISAGDDATWALNDINTGETVSRVELPGGAGYTAGHIHPDGLIYGAGGADSVVRLWDVRSQSNVQNFEGHKGKITGISFSENGYYLATSADGEAVVKFWDLRKLTDFKTIEIEDAKDTGVSKVHFDYSGQFVGAACGSELRVYVIKQWTQLCNVAGHSATIADFKFGTDAQYVVTGGSKGEVIVDGVAA
ncbi:hypothetical protein PhCBS80983_g04467 [Powellomyces hirtus]|uniref:Pre-mRNA-processing factor 19 n=1 Tax=Powellomyces hirtus TaxID=109895 RepID=A0A507DZE6_9FUNG|nr:hypothetical protein PhCBS80983_g04467 [Powellomyces hirtus]